LVKDFPHVIHDVWKTPHIRVRRFPGLQASAGAAGFRKKKEKEEAGSPAQ